MSTKDESFKEIIISEKFFRSATSDSYVKRIMYEIHLNDGTIEIIIESINLVTPHPKHLTTLLS